MSSTVTNGTITQFIAQCRQNGLKVTPQRIAIYRVLRESPDHPSADAVYRKMASTCPTISFDTVNRTLLTFAGIGIIDTVESYAATRRFDTDTTQHHHMHCVQCGQITDFCDPLIDAVTVPEEVALHFTVLGSRMVVSGICRSCSEKSEPVSCD